MYQLSGHVSLLFSLLRIGAFYFLVGNVRPHLRSKIHNIQLLLLAKYTTIVEFGIDRMLEPVVEDIRKLESVRYILPLLSLLSILPKLQENGVPFIVNKVTHHFRGTISIVSADNPASAALGGFKQSASAFRFCRHCLGSEGDTQSKVIIRIRTFNYPITHMYMYMYGQLCIVFFPHLAVYRVTV